MIHVLTPSYIPLTSPNYMSHQWLFSIRFSDLGQTYSNDVTRPENQVYSTAESSSTDDDSYLGYSMVSGHFNGDGIEDVAIGMPRGAGLLGKIVVNQWNMVNIFNITGRQIGEYFGYALATSDVDGDGMDDLIIGAPMYSEQGNTEGKYDVGRVYVLLQKRGVSLPLLDPFEIHYKIYFFPFRLIAGP